MPSVLLNTSMSPFRSLYVSRFLSAPPSSIFAVCSAKALNKGDEVVNRLIDMENVEVLAHCLLLDDVWVENEQVEVKLYTIYVLR